MTLAGKELVTILSSAEVIYDTSKGYATLRISLQE